MADDIYTAAPVHTGVSFFDDAIQQRGPQQGTTLPEYLQGQAGRPWEEVASDVRTHFGVTPGEETRQHHVLLSRRREQDLAIAQARQEEAGQPEGFEHTLYRRFLGTNALVGPLDALKYHNAVNRFQNYQATPEDNQTIARYEHLQQMAGEREQRGGWESFWDKALALPGQAANMLLAGKAVEGVAALGGFTQAAAGAAPTAGQALSAGIGRTGVMTAALPDMWLPQWVSRNEQQGRHPFDPTNLPPALTNGFIQTAILGQLTRETGVVAEAEKGLLARLGLEGASVASGAGRVGVRTAMRTAAGMVEQQAADSVTSAAGLNTGYGLLGELARHRATGEGDPMGDAAFQALQFATFAQLHYGESKTSLKEIAGTLKDLYKQHVKGETVAGGLSEALRGFQERLQTGQHPYAAAYNAPEGPFREMVLRIANEMPEQPITPARPPEGPQAAPEAPAGQTPSEPPQAQRWSDTGTAIDPQGRFQGSKNGKAYEVRDSTDQLDPQRQQVGMRLLTAHDEAGKEVGRAQFVPNEDGTHMVAPVSVEPEHQGQGVARALYDRFAREVGPIARSKAETPEGVGLWKGQSPEATVKRHLADIEVHAPDVAKELRQLAQLSPEHEKQLAGFLGSPEFKREVINGAIESATGRGWSPASIRRALGERLPQSAQVGQAPAPGQGGAGGQPPQAPQGPAAPAGDASQRGAGGPPTPTVGGEAPRHELTREGLVAAAKESITAGSVADLSEFKKLPLSELKAALQDLGIAGRPSSKADALRKIEQVMKTQAEMKAKVEEIQQNVPPGVMEMARDVWRLGDKTHFNDLEAVMPEKDWQAIKKVLGPFKENPEAANTGGGLRGTAAQDRAKFDREHLGAALEKLYHEHEIAKTAQRDGPEAASALGEGIQAGVQHAEGEEAAGGPPLTQEQLDAWSRDFDAVRASSPEPPKLEPLPPSEPSAVGGERPSGVNEGTWKIVNDFAKDESGHLDPEKIKEWVLNKLEVMKGKLGRLSDQLSKLSGVKLPALTRMARLSGEAGASFDTAPERARQAAPYFTDVVMGTQEHTEAQRQFIGATFNEWRLQHMKQAFLKEATTRFMEAQRTGKADPSVQEYLEAAKNVKSFLGTPGYAADQAAFQRDLNSPEFRQFAARWSGKGGFAEVMERNYKAARGMDPNDVIDSLTQIPGFPVNLKAVDRPEGGPGVTRGNLANTRARKLAFSNEATGSANAYETDIGKIIEHSLVRGETLAAKAKWIRQMVEDGVAQWGREGRQVEDHVQIPNVKPPSGTQEAKPGETSLYVKNEAGPEVRQLLQVDEPWKQIPMTGVLTAINLAGFTEAAYHTLNNLTMLAKPGVYPWRIAANAWKVMKADPQIMGRIIELSRIGVGFRDAHGGLLGGGKYDPTSYVSKFLDTLHRTMALTMDDAFNTLKGRDEVEDTATNRRDFINQLGNYSKRTQNGLVAFLRDTGLGSTSTAGTNYTMQAMRAMMLKPGVEATSPANTAKLKAAMLARGLGVLASVGVANFLQWGRLDGDDNTPLGALKIGEKGGKSQYLDLFGYTPWGRGLKATGAASILEGQRAGAPIGQSADRAAERVFGTLLHPFLGAPVQFGYEVATGKNAATGRRVSEDVSQPAVRGQPSHGESQLWENLKAALWNVNPAIAAISGHNAPALRSGQERDMDWQQLLGPLGPKERSTPPGAPSRYRTLIVPVDRRRR